MAPNGNQTLAAMAVHWPAIPFLIVLKAGDPLPIPDAANVHPAVLLDFTRRLALQRAEHDFYAVGLYEAANLMNGVLWDSSCHTRASTGTRTRRSSPC
ncbi:hypothetical protein TKK_0003891 [Trichogramma kaykai]